MTGTVKEIVYGLVGVLICGPLLLLWGVGQCADAALKYLLIPSDYDVVIGGKPPATYIVEWRQRGWENWYVWFSSHSKAARDDVLHQMQQAAPPLNFEYRAVERPSVQ